MPSNFQNCLQEFYDFGLEEIVRALFANTEWAAMRGTGRNMCTGGLYGSKMSQDINAKSGGRLYEGASSIWELGFDFCQIFNFAKHSTGVIYLR
jgi:hypothetical protein